VSDQPQRAFTTQFKVLIVQRIESGERLSAVADEICVRRKLLYQWRAAYRALGAAGLNRKRGPKPGGKKASGSSPGRASSDAPSSTRPGDELARAKARIAELERTIGRQQVDLDFFRRALRLMDATPPSGAAPSSTRSSKR